MVEKEFVGPPQMFYLPDNDVYGGFGEKDMGAL